MSQPTFSRDDAAGQYEIAIDGKRVGLADFRDLGDGRIVIPHTEIDPAHGGQGLGARLVSYALDDARQRGVSVVPQCPFVAQFASRHPEYADVITQ